MQTVRDSSHHFRFVALLLCCFATLLLCCYATLRRRAVLDAAAPVRLRSARATSSDFKSLFRPLFHDWCNQIFKVVQILHQKRSLKFESLREEVLKLFEIWEI
jgi:hypothetical protein